MAPSDLQATPTKGSQQRLGKFVKPLHTPPRVSASNSTTLPMRPVVTFPQQRSETAVAQQPTFAANRGSTAPTGNGFDVRRPSESHKQSAASLPVLWPRTTPTKTFKAEAQGAFVTHPPNEVSPRQSPRRQRPQTAQLPSQSNTRAPASQAAVRIRPPWANHAEVKFKVQGLPKGWSTREIHNALLPLGNIVYIDIPQKDDKDRFVTFAPPPRDHDALRAGLRIQLRSTPDQHFVHLTFDAVGLGPGKGQNSDGGSTTIVKAAKVDFGVMRAKDVMMGLHTARATPAESVQVSVDTKFNQLEIDFSVPSAMMTYDRKAYKLPRDLRYRMQINFAQISSVFQMQNTQTGETALILSIDAPPLVFRKATDPLETHEEGASRWSERRNMWFRQTEVEQNLEVAKQAARQLQQDNPIIDIGRWLTYRIIFDQATTSSKEFREMREVLEAHSIPLIKDRTIQMDFAATKAMEMWSWLDSPAAVLGKTGDLSSLSDLQQMAHRTIHLPFEVRYQLESCISHGCLHECNIEQEFLEKLSAVATDSEHGKIRAVKLLEKVVDEGNRFYDPMEIFRKIVPNMRNAFKQRQHTSHFVKVMAATITPSAIYFNPPSLEPSNRVIRHYRHYEDRFLRIRFTDEKYKGRIRGSEDKQDNEIFTRVKRTMTNGIKVGDRFYEFLAFGNAQFKENGAYFFAPVGDLDAQKIRDWMGNFTHILVVAKFCARIGQSLSTTRPTQYKNFKEIKIPDIERNGFCFTDGVGKISPLLATLITNEVGMLASNASKGKGADYASAFQFRMGGCKGVLVTDPTMGSDMSVAIRPSQEKFSVLKHTGLEICRISQFTNATLNVQIILVLSALGVQDNIFTEMMSHMLSDLELAMVDEDKAIELLQKNIDFNQMTVQIAQMILDGFMVRQDPFTISCLRLWRSWSLKYLKEKQRIFVEEGAFVLGCIDETDTLEGHCDDDPASLPEIFLQISIREHEGQYKVVEGVCMLARNPSLHPGDVRVVRAVRCEALMHIRDCVVLPQKGDRDLASMCSGGDLDGDDYLVIWDEKLIPKERNHPPMDYQAPPAVETKAKITVDDLGSFFTTFMKYNNVGLIATEHRYWADSEPDGVKSERCLELANLHSMAVDYAKTGQPAKLPKRLIKNTKPHWSNKKSTYKSNKVIGQLYDMVKSVDFVPAWDLPFDTRILDAYDLPDRLLEAAKDIKEQYDEALRRIMKKHNIQTEFEVWTTFALSHCDEYNDYKFAEKLGDEVGALKERFQKLCHLQISEDEKEQREWSTKGPFVAAMYTITAGEVAAALAECAKTEMVGGKEVPLMEKTQASMPLMSFPWLFPTELGWIANKRTGHAASSVPLRSLGSLQVQQAKRKQLQREVLGEVAEPPPLEEIVPRWSGDVDEEEEEEEEEEEGDVVEVQYTGPRLSFARGSVKRSEAEAVGVVEGAVESGDAVFDSSDSSPEAKPTTNLPELPDVETLSTPPSLGLPGEEAIDCDRALINLASGAAQPADTSTALPSAPASSSPDSGHGDGSEQDDEEVEEVVLSAPTKKSAFDVLEELLES